MATVDAVLIGAALLLVGVPLALPLIVLTWLAAFFPIIGAVTAGAAAVLVALVANGPTTALIVLAAIVVVQQIEGNVLYPVVVGPRLRLHPIVVLVAVALGGTLAGISGAFLAVPVATVCSAALSYWRERRDQRRAVAAARAARRDGLKRRSVGGVSGAAGRGTAGGAGCTRPPAGRSGPRRAAGSTPGPRSPAGPRRTR